MNSKLIGRLRFWFLNKPRHRRKKRKTEAPRVPYVGPEQWLRMKRSKVMT